MAAGVSAPYPPRISSSASSVRSPELKKRTMVAPCAAKEATDSRSGTGVLPAILVITTLWDISGSVYSMFKAAAAPQKELTPGQTS